MLRLWRTNRPKSQNLTLPIFEFKPPFIDSNNNKQGSTAKKRDEAPFGIC